ncbi:MAG: rhodanese-like domain-containing protein [Burkholderiaceae bacterium]|jgi:Rhodanese-related sulfurtransferase|nr:rhodanese-like domain-containing protein [Burkholderiaceae bacterium]
MSPTPSAPPDEDRPEAPELERLVLLDVRSPGEYMAGHVRGAINLPLERFMQDIARVAPDKDAPIVLYCVSGARSGMACDAMRQLGYRQAINGGSAANVALQLQRPIERG